jgi:hypothetical protein
MWIIDMKPFVHEASAGIGSFEELQQALLLLRITAG